MSKKSFPIFITIFLMLTFSSCTCIYFNTFHNIRKNFNEAEESRDEAGRDKAQGAEVKKYNTAITKASKVLERHPTSSWVDDALYTIGASYYYLGDYSKSARKFKELFANYPETEYASRARILYAKAKLQLNEETEAVVIFEQIFDEERNKKMKADAARALGQYYFENMDYETANRYFTSLIDSLGDQPDRRRAYGYVADGYFNRYDYNEAYQNYEMARKENPDTLEMFRLDYRMVECDFYLNRIGEALDKLTEMAENELYYDSLATIRLKMAEGYEWEGDLEGSIDTYEKVAVESEGTEASAVAYYELALIYQYDFEDLAKARGYYTKARDAARRSSVYEDATRRASMLALLEAYSKSEGEEAKADSTGVVDPEELEKLSRTQFLLGELFYFDLEKPDSAIHAFEVLVEKYPRSVYAPRALMSMAFICRQEYADTARADNLLRTILDEYSRYDEAEEVINLLGLAGTVIDTGYAAKTFAKAETYLEEFQTYDSVWFVYEPGEDSAGGGAQPGDTTVGEETIFAVIDSVGETSPAAVSTGDSTEAEDRQPPLLTQKQNKLAAARAAAEEAIRLRQEADTAKTEDGQLPDSTDVSIPETGPPDTLISADSLPPEKPAGDSSATAMDLPGVDTLSSEKDSAGTPATGQPQTDTMSAAVDTPGTVVMEKPETDTTATGADTAETSGIYQSEAHTSLAAVDTPGAPVVEISSPDTMAAGADTSGTPGVIQPEADTSLATVDSTGAPVVEIPVPDTLVAGADTAGAPGIGQPEADTLTAVADTVTVEEIPKKEFVPSIQLMRPGALVDRDSLFYRALDLLDSTRFYYQYVVDSFPHSDYSVQSRYVLLWIYDKYLAPGDSAMIDLYASFVDSFPNTEYATAIGDKYNIRPKGISAARQTQRTREQEEDEQRPDQDSLLAAGREDTPGMGEEPPSAESSAISKFITDADGNQLPPANEYYLRTEVTFVYPLEALGYQIEDNLYFQIRIDFNGEVAEAILMNPTESPELNEHVQEVVERTYFDNARIPPEMYDHWFYYTYKLRLPEEYRQ